MSQRPRAVRGVLFLQYEQGMSHARYALQDEKGIVKNDVFFTCRTCGVYWRKDKDPAGPTEDHEPPHRRPRDARRCSPVVHDFVPAQATLWDHEGAHPLASGDHLTIYGKRDRKTVVWSGVIDLEWTENVGTVFGRFTQKGIDPMKWAKWFNEARLGRLRPSPQESEPALP